MVKWVRVTATDPNERLLAVAEIVLVQKAGNRVTFFTRNGGQYDWQWTGKSTEWANLMSALDLSNAV